MSSSSPPTPADPDRLDGWKDIAAYLGRNERTVRRWEAREGVPVRRLAHDKRSSVYAYKSELEVWRLGRNPDLEFGNEPAASHRASGTEAAPPIISTRLNWKQWLPMACVLLVISGLGMWFRPWSGATIRGYDHRGPVADRTGTEAMVAYQTGIYEFNRGAFRSALSFSREAVRLDPNLALAHELLGMTLQQEADFGLEQYDSVLPEARAALQRALELDPNRGRALTWLGETYFFGEHDWIRAEANMKRGFALDPATGNNYGALLAAEGRSDEAVRVGNKALQSDPANPILIADVARLHEFARRYDEAIRLFHRAQQIGSRGIYADQFLTISLFLAGRRDEAFEVWLATANKRGGSDLEKKYRDVYQAGNWPAVWATHLDLENSSGPPCCRVYKMWCLVSLDRTDEVMDFLGQLEKKTSAWMVQLEDPLFDPVRQDPRFKALQRRVRYPESVVR